MFLSDLRKLTGPLPGFAEHLLVQLTQEALIEDFLALLACPLLALDDVELLPLVQLALRGDVAGNQAGQFVRIERRGAGG
jgi:hypothetical protein